MLSGPIPPLEEIGTRLIDPVREGPPDIIPGLLPRQGQLVIAGETNIGKAMALDTPIFTPSGWRTIADIKPGDFVYGSTGQAIKVTAVSPVYEDRPCFRVTFNDGESCVVDAEHLWSVTSTTTYPYKVPQVLTTQQLKDQGVKRGTKLPRARWRIKQTEPLKFPTSDPLPLDPYLLGSWLGDGTTKAGQFTSADPEIIDAWSEAGWKVSKLANLYSYGVDGLQRKLKDLDVYGNKHIPEIYMRASIWDRQALLAGLLDTDGYRVSVGAAEFCNTNKALIDQVYELAIQLGCKVFRYDKTPMLYGKACKQAYMLYIRAPFVPFRLSRKAQGFKVLKNAYLSITSIDPVESVPVKCLVVDAEDHLFLAGKNCVPTHNSLVALEICSSLIADHLLWGELKPTMKAKKIVYILGEHYNAVIQRLWAKTQLPMTPEVWLLGPEQLGFDKWLVTNGRVNEVGLTKLAKWAEGSDLIVFDPLAAFVTGIDAENDNVQMRLVLDTMSHIAQRSGSSTIILAHQGKPMMSQSGQEHSRKAYAIRGASGIEDAATNIFYMNRAQGTSAVAETKDHKVLTLICRKYKGEAPPEYRLMRDPETLTHTLLGNRPFVEVRKLETQARFARVKMQYPQLSNGEIIKMMAATEGVSEMTIRRHLNAKEPGDD